MGYITPEHRLCQVMCRTGGGRYYVQFFQDECGPPGLRHVAHDLVITEEAYAALCLTRL